MNDAKDRNNSERNDKQWLVDEAIERLPTVLLGIVYEYAKEYRYLNTPSDKKLISALKSRNTKEAKLAVEEGASFYAVDEADNTTLMIACDAYKNERSTLGLMLDWTLEGRMEEVSREAAQRYEGDFPDFLKYCWNDRYEFLQKTNTHGKNALTILAGNKNFYAVLDIANVLKEVMDILHAIPDVQGPRTRTWDVSPSYTLMTFNALDGELAHELPLMYTISAYRKNLAAVRIVMDLYREKQGVGFGLLRAAANTGEIDLFKIIVGGGDRGWIVDNWDHDLLLHAALEGRGTQIFRFLIDLYKQKKRSARLTRIFLGPIVKELIGLAIKTDQSEILTILIETIVEQRFWGMLTYQGESGIKNIVLIEALLSRKKSTVQLFLQHPHLSLVRLGLGGTHSKNRIEVFRWAAGLFDDSELLDCLIQKAQQEGISGDLTEELTTALKAELTKEWDLEKPCHAVLRSLLGAGARISSKDGIPSEKLARYSAILLEFQSGVPDAKQPITSKKGNKDEPDTPASLAGKEWQSRSAGSSPATNYTSSSGATTDSNLSKKGGDGSDSELSSSYVLS